MNVVSALSGSGVAYIYVMMSAMADGAVKCGLPRKSAYKIAAQAVVGAGKIVLETGKHPDEVRFYNCVGS